MKHKLLRFRARSSLRALIRLVMVEQKERRAQTPETGKEKPK